jgi:polysaccharide export outer membrane protein
MLKTAKIFAESKVTPLSLPRELDKQVLAEYRIEPGDVLALEESNFDTSVRLPGDQTVRSDGSIDLGPYGRLMVAGLTVDEIQNAVRSHIDQHRSEAEGDEAQTDGSASQQRSSVNVRLVEAESKVYYVVGEVNSPGVFPLIGRETVLDAIFAAGDLSDRADRQNIVLSRPTAPGDCRIVMPICYRHIVQLGDTSTNYQILPGDRIYVASLTFWDSLCFNFCLNSGEVCPRCACCQIPCPDGVTNIEYVDQDSHRHRAACVPE